MYVFHWLQLMCCTYGRIWKSLESGQPSLVSSIWVNKLSVPVLGGWGCLLTFLWCRKLLEPSFRLGKQQGVQASRQGRTNLYFCKKGRGESRLLPISQRGRKLLSLNTERSFSQFHRLREGGRKSPKVSSFRVGFKTAQRGDEARKGDRHNDHAFTTWLVSGGSLIEWSATMGLPLSRVQELGCPDKTCNSCTWPPFLLPCPSSFSQSPSPLPHPKRNHQRAIHILLFHGPYFTQANRTIFCNAPFTTPFTTLILIQCPGLQTF